MHDIQLRVELVSLGAINLTISKDGKKEKKKIVISINELQLIFITVSCREKQQHLAFI